MKFVAYGLFGLLVVAGLATAQQDVAPAATEAISEGELVKGKSSFRETWVNPNVDLSAYNKILPGDPEFAFRDVGPAEKYRTNMRNISSKSEFGILQSDQDKFKQVVRDAFIKELSRSKKYEVVSEAGPGTILLQGGVIDIVSHVPPQMTGRSDIYLSSVATVTLVLELLDAQTGEVLAYVEDRRKIEQPGGGRIDRFTMPANSVTVWADISRWARSSASRLRKSLEKAQRG